MADNAVVTAKNMLFVDTAVEEYLHRLGSNYGVPPPEADPANEVLYRKFIQLLAAQPKTQRRIVVQMLEILFGTKATLIAAGKRPWAIYETQPNVLTVEIPNSLVPAAPPDNAFYLHGLGGTDGFTEDPAAPKLHVKRPVDFTKAAVPMVGCVISLNGVDFVVHGLTYDAGAGENIFTLNANAPVGANNVKWRVYIPSALSFPGGYFVLDDSIPSSQVNNQRTILYGPGLVEIFKQYMLQLVKAAGIQLNVEMMADGYTAPNPSPPVTLVSIAITPSNPSIAANGGEVQLTATGTYSDLSTADLTNQVDWYSSTPTKAQVGNGEVVTLTQPSNRGFEAGDLTGWTVTGAGGVSQLLAGFGPRSGNFFGQAGFNAGIVQNNRLNRNPLTKILLPSLDVGLPALQLRLYVGFFKQDSGVNVNTQVGKILDNVGAIITTLFSFIPASQNSAPDYVEYTANLTSHAGQFVDIQLEADKTVPGVPLSILVMDDVEILPTTYVRTKGRVRGWNGGTGTAVIVAKYPNGPAGTTIVTLT